MLSALPSYFCRSFGRFLPLLGEGGDLGTHILRVQCHDVLRVFGPQQLLCNSNDEAIFRSAKFTASSPTSFAPALILSGADCVLSR